MDIPVDIVQILQKTTAYSVCELTTLSINNGVIIEKNRKQQKIINFKQNLPRAKANPAKTSAPTYRHS